MRGGSAVPPAKAALTSQSAFRLSSDIQPTVAADFNHHCRRPMSFVQIQCTRCKTMFRDRAGRLQDGYSRQCPCCEVVLFFAEDSQHPFIKRAMRNARKVRKELREADAVKRAAPQEPRVAPRSRSSTGRARMQGRSD
jgi:hypothetical protein